MSLCRAKSIANFGWKPDLARLVYVHRIEELRQGIANQRVASFFLLKSC
jgi:hypothetical protein